MRDKKIEPWRIVVGVLSIAVIVFMWARKDIVHIYATMPKEQIAPLIITTLLVSALKVGAIAAGVFLIKWIIEKLKKK